MRHRYFETKVVEDKEVIIDLDEGYNVSVIIEGRVVRYYTGHDYDAIELFEGWCRTLDRATTLSEIR